MIDPKLLTPDNGFVLGETVVEYERTGFSPAVSYLNMRILELKDIKAIHPLTGPMAIWNFLPKETVAICRGDHGYPEFQLYATHPAIVGNYGMWSGYKIEPRPWWAQKKA